MATDNRQNYKRLILALAAINSGKYEILEELPLEQDEYVISYEYKDYARVIIQPNGQVILEPLRSYIVHKEQLSVVLSVVEKILRDMNEAVAN